jgi:hypothetical protein
MPRTTAGRPPRPSHRADPECRSRNERSVGKWESQPPKDQDGMTDVIPIRASPRHAVPRAHRPAPRAGDAPSAQSVPRARRVRRARPCSDARAADFTARPRSLAPPPAGATNSSTSIASANGSKCWWTPANRQRLSAGPVRRGLRATLPMCSPGWTRSRGSAWSGCSTSVRSCRKR